jgi:hypothetical protein
VNKYALATSNDCRESEAIVVNECVGCIEGIDQDQDLGMAIGRVASAISHTFSATV